MAQAASPLPCRTCRAGKKIKNLFVDVNQLEGSIPELPAVLQKFTARSNRLSGPLPVLPSNTRTFIVRDNQLEGPTAHAFEKITLAPAEDTSIEVLDRPRTQCTAYTVHLASARC